MEKPDICRDEDFGRVEIRIEEVLRRAGISKNRLAHLALMQRSQLNSYCKGEVQRVDLAILARLCCALGCTAGELLLYREPQGESALKK